MHIPGLGTLSKDDDLDWHFSEPVRLPVLGGHECTLVIEAYDSDPAPQDFHVSIAKIGPAVLQAAQAHVYAYYLDCNAHWTPQDEEYLAIETAADVWRHIEFGDEPAFSRDGEAGGVYLSLECSCDWEREHGLQIVFRNGLEVTKVGPYNGHLTNASAYGDDSLEQVIYHGHGHA